MNKCEQVVRDAFEYQGWDVYHNGWPDFAFEKDGKLVLVEVKSAANQVRPEQKRMHELLKRHGLQVETLIVEFPQPRIINEAHIPRMLEEYFRDRDA